MAPSMGILAGLYIPRTGREEGASNCPGPAYSSTGGNILSASNKDVIQKYIK